MDFGDILEQWDKEQKNKNKPKKENQKSHKLANALSIDEKNAIKQGYSYEQVMQQDNERRANPMTVWLNRYGTVDKDKIADEAEKEALLSNREYLKNLRPEAVIDLHGLTKDEAWQKLNGFVGECKRKGLRKILIVHGKGNHSHGSDPVLGPMVRLFIEQDSRLGSSGHADRNNGGNGATWVLLK